MNPITEAEPKAEPAPEVMQGTPTPSTGLGRAGCPGALVASFFADIDDVLAGAAESRWEAHAAAGRGGGHGRHVLWHLFGFRTLSGATCWDLSTAS